MRIVIIDDQKRVCSAIKNLVKIHYPQAEVVGEAYNATSAIDLIKQERPDVVLLDIKMPKQDGFDVLRKLKPLAFKVIFITAYEEYAVKAFKFAALDYLMKPVDPAELIDALHKAKQQIQLDDLNTKVDHFINNMGEINLDPKKILIKSKGSIRIIEIKEIIRCEADDRYTTFFLADGKTIVSSETLKVYDEMLSPLGFFRSHNSHLVNISHIQSFEKRNEDVLVMRDGSIVPVAVRKKEMLLEMLQKI